MRTKNQMMENFWNDRYRQSEYVYGETANVFLAEQLSQLKPGKLILPCEGEGRNAVHAAKKGWIVDAFDSSTEGKKKSMLLAEKNKVKINYDIANAQEIEYAPESADVVAFIYAHFPAKFRKEIHQKSMGWLRPGGILLLEAFNPAQLQNNSGGPKEEAMLYTTDMLRNDFSNLKIDILETLQTNLQEGKYHEGKADIIRFSGRKI